MKTAAFLRWGSLSLVLGAFVLGSCSKQRTEDPILAAYSKPEKFMYDNRPEEQTFILNGDSAGPIIGNQGTHLWMDSTIFMFPDGSDVPYPIVIKLIELYTPKDMMLYEMPTVAQNVPLVTGGEIRVRAFKDNVELLLKPNKVYPAKMPSANPLSAMSIYYGKDQNGIIDWNDLPSAVSSNPGIDALEFIAPDSAFYSMLIPALGWINADYVFSWTSGNATLVLDSETDDLTNVVKFAYYPQTHSVVQFYGNTSINLPAGEPVRVVCFAQNLQGVLHLYNQEFTPSTGANPVMVTLAPLSDQALLDALSAL